MNEVSTESGQAHIFLQTRLPSTTLVNTVSKFIGSTLMERKTDVGDLYTARTLDIEVTLFREHGLEDDAGIEFSKYEYQIDLVPFHEGADVPEFDEFYKNIAKFIASKLSISLECRTLVVENLQHQIAAFDRMPKSSGPSRANT